MERELSERLTIVRLIDIYGGLLTARQLRVLRMYYLNDFSLGEIAERLEITRQAVFDSLQRSVNELNRLESSLHLTVDHYFTTLPKVASRRREVLAHLRGRSWSFLTDRGVFGHRAVDPGTRLLIDTMIIHPADDVLDLGCGYGPAGIVAATLAPQGRIVMIDINERAVALAAENARRHGLLNVEVLQGDGLEPVLGRRFTVVVTNPPIRTGRATLRRLFREASEHLHDGGRLYFVARTAQGAKTLAREVADFFGNVREVAKRGGYRVYEATKRDS